MSERKLLQQYLAEYIDTELGIHEKVTGKKEWCFNDLLYWIDQGIQAYESTEGIRITYEEVE